MPEQEVLRMISEHIVGQLTDDPDPFINLFGVKPERNPMQRIKLKRKIRWSKFGKRSYNLADFWQLIIYDNRECWLSRGCDVAMPISRQYAALVLRSHFQKV